MMTHQQIKERLDDYVDGILSPSETEEITRHLDQCPECSSEVAELRALLAEAARLPAEIAPERDLWPGIAKSIEPKKGSVSRMRLVDETGPAPRVPSEFVKISARRLLLAAAALALLMLLPATITHHLPDLLRGFGEEPSAPTDVASVLDENYSRVRLSCARSLEENFEIMDPHTIVAFQAGAAAADLATAELRAALALVGDDSEMIRMLSEGYMKQINLVQRLDRRAATL